MLAEIPLGDVLMPALLPGFVAAVALFLPLDWLVGRCGLYRLLWHPSLARFGLFLCVVSTLAWLG